MPAIKRFDQIILPNLGPMLVYGFLFFTIGYTLYQSAPRFGMKKIKGVVSSQICTGNAPPYGCKVEVEIQQNGEPRKVSFTGSFNKMYDTFQEVEIWSNPEDNNDFVLERHWSGDGLALCMLLILVLFLYSIYRFVTNILPSTDEKKEE